MNLLYASVAYPPSVGGGEIHLHRLAQELRYAGHTARAICQWSRTRSDWLRGSTWGADPGGEYVQDGIPVTRLEFSPALRRRLRPRAWFYRRRPLRGPAVRGITRLIQPVYDAAAGGPLDVVHALRQGCEFLAEAARVHARRIGVPFVVTALHHPGWHGGKYRHWDRIFRSADAVVALTEQERRTLIERKGVAASRVHVTGIGPVLAPRWDVDAFRARWNLQRPFVLFLGRKAPHKGWRQLLAAAPRVFEREPEVDLVFAGEDTAASAAAFDAQTDGRIRNLGGVDLATKTAALAGCALLCLPSTLESFGGVLTEAWACGRPVVARSIPAVRELVDDGVDGLLCGARPEELADRILALLRDSAQASRLGEAGRRKVEARFTWPRLAAATLHVYESALGASTSST